MDNAWEQEKLEARKMLENAAESPASSARFVGRFLGLFELLFLVRLVAKKYNTTLKCSCLGKFQVQLVLDTVEY